MVDKSKIAIAIEVQEALKEKLLQRIAFVEEEIESLKHQLKQQNAPVNPNQSSTNQISPNGIHYDIKASWVNKVWFLINQERRFLHSREIQEFILTKEPNHEPKALQRKISGALARLKKEKTVVNHKVGKTNLSFVWGVPQWLDENNKIKNGHEFKPGYVEDKRGQRRIIYD